VPNITAQNIVDRAAIIVQDETGTRWPESELLDWLNDGQREIVLLKPDANAQNEALQLDSGTKQSIPTDGLSLIDIVRNMGTDGDTPGRAVRFIQRSVLDDQLPNWHAETQKTEIQHYMFDDRDPERFYVYPPADGTSYIEIVYADTPTEVSLSDNISLGDFYANALLDFVLFKAYQKDADHAVSAERVMYAYRFFRNSLGLMDVSEAKGSPSRTKKE